VNKFTRSAQICLRDKETVSRSGPPTAAFQQLFCPLDRSGAERVNLFTRLARPGSSGSPWLVWLALARLARPGSSGSPWLVWLAFLNWYKSCRGVRPSRAASWATVGRSAGAASRRRAIWATRASPGQGTPFSSIAPSGTPAGATRVTACAGASTSTTAIGGSSATIPTRPSPGRPWRGRTRSA